MIFPSSKLAQFEQDLKHLHHELRSKEIFLTKVNIFFLCRKTLELEEELKVVGNNMKSLEVSEQEVVDQINRISIPTTFSSSLDRIQQFH